MLAATSAIGPAGAPSETSPLRVGRGEREADRHGGQGHRHQDRAVEQDRLSSHAVDQEDRDERHEHVRDARHDADAERGALRESDRSPQRRRVVEDHVDAHELLEHRQDDAHPDDRLAAPARVRATRRRRSCGRPRSRSADRSWSCRGRRPGRAGRRSSVASASCPWRRGSAATRAGEREDAVHRRGDRADDEHPAPRRRARATALVGAARARQASTASVSSATKIPNVIASCWSEPRRPRICRGEISAM